MAVSDKSFEVRLLVVLLAAVAFFALWVIPASVKDPAGFGYSEGLAPSFSVYLVAILAAITLAGRLVRILAADASAIQNEIGSTFSKPDPADQLDAQSETDETASDSKMRTGIILATCLLFPFLLIPYLGFYISSFGFVLFLAVVMGERRLPVLLLLPVLLVSGIYAGFELGFTIFLPRGEIILQLLELIGDRG
jgi:hypothetical protein